MATRSYERLILTSGQTYTQPAGDTIIVLNYTAGDWDGAILLSDTPGTPFYLNVPIAGITVVGTSFTDCDASGGGAIDATDSGVDGGGNDNISFPSGGGVGILFAIYEDDREE
jgi:hypothetical protein